MMLFLKIFKYFFLFIIQISFAWAQTDTPIVLPIIQDSSFIYESNLSYKKNSFGGLLITKKQENKLRITLTSKFGMKIFDFLLDKDSIHTIYAVEQLDKNIIKNMFYKDFRMIYPFLFDAKKIKHKKEKVIIKHRLKRYKYLYQNGELIKIKKGLGLTKVKIGRKSNKMEDLEIIHTIIGLKIKIKPLILLNE